MIELTSFEVALRDGYRYPAPAEMHQSEVNTEDLFSLPLTSNGRGLSLDVVAREIFKRLKNCQEEIDFVGVERTTDSSHRDYLEARMEIVKRVIEYKKQEKEQKQNSKSIEEHNRYIDSLIAEKEVNNMREMSVEDLKKLKK